MIKKHELFKKNKSFSEVLSVIGLTEARPKGPLQRYWQSLVNKGTGYTVGVVLREPLETVWLPNHPEA